VPLRLESNRRRRWRDDGGWRYIVTRLTNDPRDFAAEMIEGFIAANPAHVRGVDGGVVRATRLDEGKVGVVIGGGSGHYPAFAGLVGEGIAAGAAMGNLFASPAAAHVVSVARAAERRGGILLTYGNYAGDVLNFDEAQEVLRAEGVDCETVVVTDDISSAPAGQKQLRRGIAGDLVVFKCAGAAAEAGHRLADVARIARLANERTRTSGAAFSGCTLPGAGEPLFTVPEGRMALGMGIHGEPGIAEVDLPTADGLAEILVEQLLAERPAEVKGDARVIPILNGLGSVKYEEMFVVYRRVSQLLQSAGLTVLDPQVGEFCTSFDMAGISLTLFWPDDELLGLWGAPADTPAYRRGRAVSPVEGAPAVVDATPSRSTSGSVESQRAAALLVGLIEASALAVEREVDELGRLDSVAGDGDHGLGMSRGVAAAIVAARSAAESGAGAGTLLSRAGEAWALDAGGTSGALWGAALRAMGDAVGDDAVPAGSAIGDILAIASARVRERGGAQIGDKTMVDALVPFEQTFVRELAAGAPVAVACDRAAQTASAAAAATAELIPRVGRARPHAERSLGTPDPGAHSLALIATAVADALKAPPTRGSR
jgi:dihydroxyacetone kinase